ncbi:MAG: hypothetical protein JJ866_06225 [Roseibium sp.]|uniref:hypothetical protein n=1 Tax=Roseibium sp. TaxID=1936156 RepID=UPI001B01D8CC|nr:hypothetical protein [Roseibium sp.]MBO6891519.1 hypothetical protein [Roseibium sp.]MBO6931057.1 hypothetical protein [Roseibium sp.]
MKQQIAIAISLCVLSIEAHSQNNSANIETIKSNIISEVVQNCKAGSQLQGADQAFSLNSADNLVVEFGRFSCPWEFNNHFFCGARACEVREYQIDGSQPILLKTYLRY